MLRVRICGLLNASAITLSAGTMYGSRNQFPTIVATAVTLNETFITTNATGDNLFFVNGTSNVVQVGSTLIASYATGANLRFVKCFCYYIKCWNDVWKPKSIPDNRSHCGHGK